jgi:hypothetical protein
LPSKTVSKQAQQTETQINTINDAGRKHRNKPRRLNSVSAKEGT